MKEDIHVFTGMRRDNHPIKQDIQMLWDARNMRLTSRNEDTANSNIDSNTMLSLTNESSTGNIFSIKDKLGAEDVLYIGHCVLGKYIVLFLNLITVDTEGNNTLGTIVRIDTEKLKNKEEEYLVTLYSGENLDFSVDNPIQAIGVYESEFIQKVYWVDGLNSPRVINITKRELLMERLGNDYNEETVYQDAPFDFVQELELHEEITADRVFDVAGTFHSGVIQYAFTYYYKYGQESNIFYTTPIMNISYPDRGANAEDMINCAFKFTIRNVDAKFDYIRVYSILRTSKDAVPTVKRVMDIELLGKDPVEFIDTGTTGDIFDPQALLFLGGQSIVAGCISSMENTMFLGNLKYKRESIKKAIDSNVDLSKLNITASYVSMDDTHNSKDGYTYKNTLGNSSYSCFKTGDTYRLGIQAQYKDGSWSEPVFVGDKEVPRDVIQITENKISKPIFKYNLSPNSPLVKLSSMGYKKIRPLIAVPSIKDRTILAQGILCPTVFQINNRINNSPFSQSSWFLRPFITDKTYIITTNIPGYTTGSIPEFRHYANLFTGFNYGAEIQNMFYKRDSDSDSGFTDINPSLKDAYDKIQENKEYYKNAYYVDQSIVTFHSPDIEFDEALQNLINNNKSLFLKIVGAIPFDVNLGKVEISTSSVTANVSAKGVNEVPKAIGGGEYSLFTGGFYEDSRLDDKGDNGHLTEIAPEGDIRTWLVYLWNRAGSLTNDIARPAGMGQRTSVLKKKVVANLKYSSSPFYFKKPLEIDKKTTQFQMFNSNEVSLIKFKDDKNKEGNISYYGNVDTLNPTEEQYRALIGEEDNRVFKYNGSSTFSSGRIMVYSNPEAINLKLDPNGSSKLTNALGKYIGNRSGDMEDCGGYINRIMDNKWPTVFFCTIPVQGMGGEKFRCNFTLYGKGAFMVDDLVGFNKEYLNGYTGNERLCYVWTGTAIPVNNTIVDNKTMYYAIWVHRVSEGFPAINHDTIESKYPSSFFKRLRAIDTGKQSDGEYWGSKKVTLGDYNSGVKYYKDPIRIKYKSTPHVVIKLNEALSVTKETLSYDFPKIDIPLKKHTWLWDKKEKPEEAEISLAPKIFEYKDDITGKNTQVTLPEDTKAYLYLAEIHQDVDNRYGGTNKEALQNNLWIPAGDPVIIEDGKEIRWNRGDTWIQRYDCMKTYPFAQGDENQVVEIGSFMVETRVNIDGRYDRNRGLSDNTKVSPTNFNLINKVYSQLDNFFNYRIMDQDYYLSNHYPSQIAWSLPKNNGDIHDTWTQVTMANTLDLDGRQGKVTAIVPFNDTLLGFQESGIQHLIYNPRVQIQASDGVPIEIANSQKMEGARIISDTIGCQDKFAITTSPFGIYFVDNNNNSVYVYNGQISDVGANLGSLYWFRENYSNNTWRFHPNKISGNNGIRLAYDPKYKDVYFTPGPNTNNVYRDSLCFSELTGKFTGFYSYDGAVLIPTDNDLYSIQYSYKKNENGEYVMDISTGLCLHKHIWGKGGTRIFGKKRKYSFSFVSNATSTVNKTFDTVEMRANLYNVGEIFTSAELKGTDITHLNQTGKPFTHIRVDTESQDTAETAFTDNTLRKKFNIWRGIIPRDKKSNSLRGPRIKNMWARIELSNENETDEEMPYTILHDITVKYSL